MNYSHAIEYCLISHKQLEKKTSLKDISEIFIYFHEICLHEFY